MNWEMKSLDQLGHVSRGRSRHRPRDADHLYGGPYPFVQTSDVKHANLYLMEYSQTYSEAGLAQSRLWNAGTLCITIAANIADTAILGIDACFPDSVIGFIPDKGKADARFIKYLFDAYLQRRFQKFTQGAAQDNLSQSKLLSLKFPVPEIQTQIRIADILSSYDNLIENDRRRIQLLEEAARLIYREWFVHLRFPGHDVSRSLNVIPEGWQRDHLQQIADVTMGQSPKSIFYNEDADGLPFHQGVSDYGHRFPTHRIYCTVQKRIAEEGDILFSVRAPVGRINIAGTRLIIGRGLAAIRATKVPQSFLFYALREIFFKDDLIGAGAIYASITKKDLLQVEVIIPTPRISDEFNALVEPIDNQVAMLSSMSSKLERARDMLLPRLMSGEIAV